MSQVKSSIQDNENPSLFNNPSNLINEQKNPEDYIEKRYQIRQSEFTSEENFNKIKEDALISELNFGQNERIKMFNKRRIFQKKKYDNLNSLKNKIMIPLELYEECEKIIPDYNSINDNLNNFKSDDISVKYKALVSLKKILLKSQELINEEEQKEIQIKIINNIINDCILLLNSSYPEFQVESLICLNEMIMISEDYCCTIIAKGGLSILIKNFDSNISEIQENSIITIRNLIQQSPDNFKQFVQEKGYEKLINKLTNCQNPSILIQCVNTISSFIKIKNIELNYNTLIKPLIYPLIRTFSLIKDNENFISESTWLLGIISDKYIKSRDEIIQSGIISVIINLIENSNSKYIKLCSLRIIGNMISGNANQTQEILNLGVLNVLKKTLFHEKSSIRKETAWILSNICSGTQKQIECIIDNGFLELFNKCLKNDIIDVKNEIYWAITNLTIVNNFNYMKKIIDEGIVEIICSLLKEKNTKILCISLEALGNLLIFGKKNSVNGRNFIVEKIENCGAEDDLVNLQYHSLDIVYQKALYILENYFDTEPIF